MKRCAAIGVLLLAGCGSRFAAVPTSLHTASLVPSQCESGEPAVTLWAITALATGETKEFNLAEPPVSGPVHLRPGRYEIEAGCNRSTDSCGRMLGWVHLDGAPTARVKIAAGEQVRVDCDASTAALKVGK